MRRKRHEEHEDHVDESWLIPYADMLTLLLALFIVLFAASTVDAKKYQAITQSFQEVLSGDTGILEGEPAMLDPEDGSTVSMSDEKEKRKKKKSLKTIKKKISCTGSE